MMANCPYCNRGCDPSYCLVRLAAERAYKRGRALAIIRTILAGALALCLVTTGASAQTEEMACLVYRHAGFVALAESQGRPGGTEWTAPLVSATRVGRG
jgi:hypothetical protein